MYLSISLMMLLLSKVPIQKISAKAGVQRARLSQGGLLHCRIVDVAITVYYCRQEYASVRYLWNAILFMILVNYAVTHGMMKWYTEKENYNFATRGCASGKICGHYTQVQIYLKYKASTPRYSNTSYIRPVHPGTVIPLM